MPAWDETDRMPEMTDITKLHAELEALKNSTSWRLTAPLRSLSSWVKRRYCESNPAATAAKPPPPHVDTKCRLCGGETFCRWRKMVLLKYDVGYHECRSCGSIQTDTPYWLDEAYAIPGVHLDVGIANRTLQMWITATSFLEEIGFPRTDLAVDFGAASGLFARLMRDAGFNFYAHDKYSDPFFVNYFTIADISAQRPSLITAFEVFEHLRDPNASIGDLLDLGADAILFSTGFFSNQGPDWQYLVPECGQHVFFYTERGLGYFAGRFGYDLLGAGRFHVLLRRGVDSRIRKLTEDFPTKAESLYEVTGARLLRTTNFYSVSIQADLAVADQRFRHELSERR
jgi:hypothetical protein